MITYKQFISESKKGMYSTYIHQHNDDPTLGAKRTKHISPEGKIKHSTVLYKKKAIDDYNDDYDHNKPKYRMRTNSERSYEIHNSENDAMNHLKQKGYSQKGMSHLEIVRDTNKEKHTNKNSKFAKLTGQSI